MASMISFDSFESRPAEVATDVAAEVASRDWNQQDGRRDLPGPREPSSGDLVRRAANGDQTAWRRLVDRYSGMVWEICRSAGLNQQDAGDVAQVVWLRLVENLDRLRDVDRVGGWLATTAKRERLRAIRLRSRESEGQPDAPDPAPGPYERLELAECIRSLSEALRRLPERDQKLLRMLAEPDRPPYARIAEKLGIPIGSVGPTRMRALSKLRRELASISGDQYPWAGQRSN